MSSLHPYCFFECLRFIFTGNHEIGVLALQGAFIEHALMLQRLSLDAVEVRLPQELIRVDGLIIPGGESTTIGKLAVMYQLIEPLRRLPDSRMLDLFTF